MQMTLTELERLAYIRGRTFLARAYAAADDNAKIAEQAIDALPSDDAAAIGATPVSEMPQLIAKLGETQAALAEIEPQITLEI